ncbi:carbamoyltransferase HypF [Sulfurimonas lithotrophica]|uniref:Carbamoyltransferase n=1 Tax=Sulfurimonas lithotrophica TaxID=2590022 RepID=A0A5P8P049_9BACT|nr:carbamoyltransferase HypF [Sulfurimonas lithotrophica]QFR48970.1 carbamoyltransferase HypF [Sulfurimonas lithotrophica]
MTRKHYFIEGVVQGVGFRPFIYKVATELGLSGFVKNTPEGVEIELQGCIQSIEDFEKNLKTKLPVLARIDAIESNFIKVEQFQKSFEILQSDATQNSSKTTLVSPDISVCDDCLKDLKNTRFKNYFATNCTNCGPRYSIIKTLPYDRKNTSMQKFEMCQECQRDYENPQNRRYHAQPISCPNCGPKLSESIELAAKKIIEGKIVAIKGIGGFHIVCDARDDNVIRRLRKYKNRPSKPFAIMCQNIEQVKKLAKLNDKEVEILDSKERPIVILNKEQNSLISDLVAPNIDRIGCFLPYTPLHHMLFEFLYFPILATSANLGGEPIITTKEMIKEKLPFVDFILDFDRDIVNAVDDSVVQVVNNKKQVLRLARGYAPKVIKIPFKIDKKILAVGANQKDTIALSFEDNIILSPHIGDLDSLMSLEYFKRTIKTFEDFYDFKPELIVHDKHPNYETTKWAREQNIQLKQVQHHLAHIYATKAEFGLSGEYLGFSFDGTGFGDDKTLWGGEIFVGDKRKYHFKPIKLIGADKAIKEPRRVALSMLFDNYTLEEILELDLACVKEFSSSNIKLLHQSYIKNINSPLSSSVGRLFDAIASMAGLLQMQSYEGEAGLMCEMAYNSDIEDTFKYKIDDGKINIEYDFFDKNLVSKFINTLVDIVFYISKKEKMDVILSGGVFQNKTLLELIIKKLKDEKIKYYFQQKTPINDGGISLGQIYNYIS